ncbi:WXG100 family type VII secretion target [Skermania piniformis]|uniref:ESAT-6-like protein n=1 Tax=Skermania pinensis TaxID=39122 RepID=A0ABX8S9U2_9ACTN|nr:WXG100 family type VII secretion target [Skermania piniformis]QXQ14624.1 WXG100 family type VII secretion target [Skermania piniformis]
MKYEFGQMMQLAADIQTTSGRLTSSHDQLTRYVEGLVAQWESSARDAYRGVQQQWDLAHNDLITTLARISRVVAQGTSDMQATEARNAASWG